MAYVVKTPSDGEMFALKVLESYGGNQQDRSGQKKLIQGYYVIIDRALQEAESKRPETESVKVNWNNVNMTTTGRELVNCARAGLDALQEKQIRPVITKTSDGTKYDVTMEIGTNGIRHLAMRYAVTAPKDVTVELVHASDKFTPTVTNDGDSYKLELETPFDRGEIVGGFAYLEYDDATRNKLVMLNRAELEKRIILDGGSTGDDGWFAERCLDALKREAYDERNIPRDPDKIDDAYWYLKMKG